MSPRERAIRELIERLDGLERRVLVDAYRHLVFAHLVASDGKRAVRRLDAEYPGQGVFEPARTGTGEYAFALNSASDMLEGNIEHNDDLAPDTREALRVLLDRLVADGTFPAPASPTASSHPKGSGEPPDTGRTRALIAVRLVPYRRANIESGEGAVSYSVDPTERDERTQDQMRLQNDFADFLTSVGVQPLSVQGIDVDLAWREKNEDRLVVGEVKTLNLVNEKRQIRLGLGQLLDYLDRLSEETSPARGVLVVEHEPTDSRWNGFLGRHGIVLVWPSTYERALGPR